MKSLVTIAGTSARAVLLALVGLLACGPAAADAERLQAAMIFNFAKFVRWADADAERETLQLCLISAAEVAQQLQAVEGRTVGKRTLTVRSVTEVTADEPHCDVAFYGDQAAEPVQYPHILTVGLQAAFLERGGMISLDIANNKLVFDINLEALRAQQLDLSAQVLALARAVR